MSKGKFFTAVFLSTLCPLNWPCVVQWVKIWTTRRLRVCSNGFQNICLVLCWWKHSPVFKEMDAGDPILANIVEILVLVFWRPGINSVILLVKWRIYSELFSVKKEDRRMLDAYVLLHFIFRLPVCQQISRISFVSSRGMAASMLCDVTLHSA